MKDIFFISVLLLTVSCLDKQVKILPKEQSLTESVYASATIQPDSLYQVYAIVSGILDEVFVEEGDLVTKNKPLFQIINKRPTLNSQNAKFALELAKENYNGSAAILSSIKDEIDAARLKLKNDSINYYRQKNLWKQHIGSRLQYDTKKLTYELASNQLKLLKNKYNRTKNELKTTVKQAQNNYHTATIATNDFTVTSKMDGKIYALFKEPGEIITSIEPIAAIGSANRFVIKLLVDEVDIVRILNAQRVLINLEAYSDSIFKAQVSKIYPKKDERNQTFTVEAIFENQPEVLYPGLSGEANIIIAKKDKVLTIPKSYLIDKDKVKTDEGIVSVKIGLQNMDTIEILSGINKNNYIYKPNK
ncbi:efflux RND transporter periplasmic adaptor subunit [Winogradskyella schleiferi]|uniref:efflux RND transporter periplasmic adaptor subunit n=1 Tax=Winogradskyella schleiferi TaxID=2686078 RepID=UPI0015C035CE|nr:efflux RND transporter periplasmic adaptor subunit [Winogradskyella schleiferi]